MGTTAHGARLDFQGGWHILLQVDANDVRRQKLQSLQDDVRKLLREARIGLVRAPVIRGNSVEVIVREADVQQALAKLRDLSQPIGTFLGADGARSVNMAESAAGGVIRLTVAETAILERTRQVVDQSVEIIGRRVNAMGLVEPSIQRQGIDGFSSRSRALATPKN